MNWEEEQAATLRSQLRKGLPPRIATIDVGVRRLDDGPHVVAYFRHRDIRHVVGIDYPIRDESGRPVSLHHDWRLWQLDELFDTETIKRLDVATPDSEGVVWREFEDL